MLTTTTRRRGMVALSAVALCLTLSTVATTAARADDLVKVAIPPGAKSAAVVTTRDAAAYYRHTPGSHGDNYEIMDSVEPNTTLCLYGIGDSAALGAGYAEVGKPLRVKIGLGTQTIKNDGSLKPDPNNTEKCDSIASSVPYVRKIAPGDLSMAIILAAVAVALVGGSIGLIIKSINTKILPALAQDIDNRYAGFYVSANDFGYVVRMGRDKKVKYKTFCRINSDGTPIKLARWWFDNNTGEFKRITKRDGDNVLVNKNGYSVRLKEYMHDKPEKYGFGAMVSGLSSIALIAIAVNIGSSGGAFTFWVVGIAAGAAAVQLAWNAGVSKSKDERVGPEPLERITDDFGAETAETPVRHPAQDDLAYRPNS